MAKELIEALDEAQLQGIVEALIFEGSWSEESPL